MAETIRWVQTALRESLPQFTRHGWPPTSDFLLLRGELLRPTSHGWIPMKWFSRLRPWGFAASAMLLWSDAWAQNYYPNAYSNRAYPASYPSNYYPAYPTNFRQPNGQEAIPPGSAPSQLSPIPNGVIPQGVVPSQIPQGTSSILNQQPHGNFPNQIPNNAGQALPNGNGFPGNPSDYNPQGYAPVAPTQQYHQPLPQITEPQYAPAPQQYSPSPQYSPAPSAPRYATEPPMSSGMQANVYGSPANPSGMNCGPGGASMANGFSSCEPSSPATMVDYFDGGPANSGWFFVSDVVLWSFNKGAVTEFGDPGSEGPVTVNNVTYPFYNNFNSSWVDSAFRVGPRFEFGRICDCRGWMAGIMDVRYQQSYSATNVNYIPDDPYGLLMGYASDGTHDADINGNHIYGRDGQDLGTPDSANPGSFIAPFDGTIDAPAATDLGDLLRWLPTFATVRATSSLHLTGFELSDVHRSPTSDWCQSLDWFWGLRYLRVRDQYGVMATGGILGDSSYTATADNDIIGPQIGARYLKHNGWVGYSLEGRFLAGYNHQENRLSGITASAATPGGRDAPVALSPSSFYFTDFNSEFSPVGELRANVSWNINRWCAFRMGYTALIVGNMSRSNEKVHFALPSPTLTNTANRETLFGSGINFGLEINR